MGIAIQSRFTMSLIRIAQKLIILAKEYEIIMKRRKKDKINSFAIWFYPIEIPAFGKEKGLWTNYDAVSADRVTSITVEAGIGIEDIHIQSYSIQGICLFDPDTFPESRYGLVYDDRQFEEELNLRLRSIMNLKKMSSFEYTEQGGQSNGVISLEAASDWLDYLLNISREDILALTQAPQIESILINDFVWSRDKLVENVLNK